ncbi:MAG: Hpt domain-containing protein, partial [Lachnospiraceae bacterium]|nr:Hpt domain-containing protein [Lachnospiraceae bacterium]
SGAREKYLEQGFTDYLSKPVEGAALEAMLIRYLPKEKVRTDVAGAKKTVRADEGESALRAFYMTAGLDYESAIRSCGTDAILEKSLAQFYRAIEKNAGEIERFLAEQDYRNYTIRVHALKSSARLIGALRLSEDAQFLEECGNNLTDDSLIEMRDETPVLLAAYRALSGTLAPYFETDEETKKPAITEEALREKYDLIRTAAEDFDSDRIDEIIAEIRGFTLPEEAAGQFAKIEACATDMDWDGLEEALHHG